ncbi:hypothetical protein ACWEOZ_38755 [Actinoplanes sp. NPDC004185]
MVLIRARRDRSWRVVAAWGVTLTAALVVLSPVAWLGVRQRNSQLAWVDPLTVGALGSAPGQIVGSVPTAWLLVGLAVVAYWRPVSAVVPVALLAAAPVTVVAAVSVLVAPLWVARYLLVVLVPLAMLAAVTVVGQLRVDRKPRGHGPAALRLIVVLAVVAATAYPGQRSVRGATAKNGPDYRSIAALIERHQRPGDGMVFEVRSRAMRAGVEYYLHRDRTFPRDLLQRRSAADAGRLMAEEYPDAAARVAGTPRVWLLVSGPRQDPVTGYPALRSLLRDHHRRVGVWPVNRGTVALYRCRC